MVVVTGALVAAMTRALVTLVAVLTLVAVVTRALVTMVVVLIDAWGFVVVRVVVGVEGEGVFSTGRVL